MPSNYGVLAHNIMVSAERKDDGREARKPCAVCGARIEVGDLFIRFITQNSFGHSYNTYFHWNCYWDDQDKLKAQTAQALGCSENDLRTM